MTSGPTTSARHRARTLELVIRAAVAEERELERRLERLAESQRQTRAQVERTLVGKAVNGNGRPHGGASPQSSSDR